MPISSRIFRQAMQAGGVRSSAGDVEPLSPAGRGFHSPFTIFSIPAAVDG